MRQRARTILEGALYVLMLGADLIGVAFATRFISTELARITWNFMQMLWPFIYYLLWITAVASIIAAIIGPWRLRGRVALWGLCIAAAALIPREIQKHVPDPFPVVIEITLPVIIGFVGLIVACVLPIIWLTSLTRSSSVRR